MSNKKKVVIVLAEAVIIVAIFLIGFFIGQSNQSKPDILKVANNNSQTFYAEIEEIKEYNGATHVLVNGLEVNDINWRGKYYFSITDNIDMTWRGEKTTISDLDVGDKISITFTDEIISAIYPTPLNEIIKIQLLEDEK